MTCVSSPVAPFAKKKVAVERDLKELPSFFLFSLRIIQMASSYKSLPFVYGGYLEIVVIDDCAASARVSSAIGLRDPNRRTLMSLAGNEEFSTNASNW